MQMKLFVQRLDPRAPLPAYQRFTTKKAGVK